LLAGTDGGDIAGEEMGDPAVYQAGREKTWIVKNSFFYGDEPRQRHTTAV